MACSRRWGYSIIGIAKEVASPRTDAPETPTLQRALSTQSKIQLSRREEQLILGPTRAHARAWQTHFSHFSRLCLHLGCAHNVKTTSHPHHLEPPSPPAATAMPPTRGHPTRGHPPGAALSPPLSSSTPPERGLPYPRPLRDAPGGSWESALALSGRGRTRSQCMRPGSRKGKDGAAGKAGSLVLLPRAKWHHSSQIATKDGSNGVTLRAPPACAGPRRQPRSNVGESRGVQRTSGRLPPRGLMMR